jgi:hypothetical protein
MTCRDEVLSVARSLAGRSSDSTFSLAEILAEMSRRGTQYPESTIRTHVASVMCVNAPENHAVVFADLERVGRGLYRLVGSG